MTDSPLATANPDSLSALFLADPLDLTEADRLRMVLELRRRRNEFTASEAADKAKGKRGRARGPQVPASTAAALDKPAGEIDLGDLM